MIALLLASALASPDIRADAFRWEVGAVTPRVDGLHRADVDLDAFAAGLRPLDADVSLETPDGSHALTRATADLVVANTTSAWQELSVMGTAIGRIGPYGRVTVRGVPAGHYAIVMTNPIGFVTERIATASSPGE